MKRTLLAALTAVLMATGANAEIIGAPMSLLEHPWLAVMVKGMVDHAEELGVDLQVEDSTNDVSKQLNQVQNFVAAGVDAIVVNVVDTSSTQAMSDAAEKAGIPLVYVNREPINIDSLPDNQAFVASNEFEAGTLQAFEICKMLRAQGKASGAKAVILVGELSNQGALQRTQAVKDVLGMNLCNFIEVVEEQTANWNRAQAQDLVTNWISAGVEFDAVIANNDEMALGAAQALKAAGASMDDVIIGGIDAIEDALLSMKAGDLDLTVFQDAAGQGKGSLDAALKLARGEEVDRTVYIPFELVTSDNLSDYLGKN